MKTNKYDGLLLDIDNTIYDYVNANSAGINAVVLAIEKQFNVNRQIIKQAYFNSRFMNGCILAGTASSHSRLLYIQGVCERLNINPIKHAIYLHEIFWKAYFDSMKLFDGVVEICKKYRNNIVIVSDLTSEIQYKKLKYLNLDKYIDKIVTSEEAGVEKPHPFIFTLAKRKLAKSNLVMIGDSFDKDIMGANMAGIKAIYLNSEDRLCQDFNGIAVKKFKDIVSII